MLKDSPFPELFHLYLLVIVWNITITFLALRCR